MAKFTKIDHLVEQSRSRQKVVRTLLEIYGQQRFGRWRCRCVLHPREEFEQQRLGLHEARVRL